MDTLSRGDDYIVTVALICTTITSVVFYMILAFSNGRGKRRGVRDPNDVFRAKKKIGVKEEVLLKMLSDTNDREKGACYVITDPNEEDNPIVYASPGFCTFTEYSKKEVENRNCRFLQGAMTDPQDVKLIRDAIRENREVSVELLNYKKSGETFLNQFFLMPIKEADGSSEKVAYYLGVQCELEEGASTVGFNQEGKNPGWRLFHWL